MAIVTEQVYRHYKTISITQKENNLTEWVTRSRFTETVDKATGIIAEVDAIAEAYAAPSVMTVNEANGGDDVATAAEINFQGGFNMGDEVVLAGTFDVGEGSNPFSKTLTIPFAGDTLSVLDWMVLEAPVQAGVVFEYRSDDPDPAGRYNGTLLIYMSTPGGSLTVAPTYTPANPNIPSIS